MNHSLIFDRFRPLRQASLLLDCVPLRCISCTKPPHDILVTYAGNGKGESRNRTVSAATERTSYSIHHFTTFFSITFTINQLSNQTLPNSHFLANCLTNSLNNENTSAALSAAKPDPGASTQLTTSTLYAPPTIAPWARSPTHPLRNSYWSDPREQRPSLSCCPLRPAPETFPYPERHDCPDSPPATPSTQDCNDCDRGTDEAAGRCGERLRNSDWLDPLTHGPSPLNRKTYHLLNTSSNPERPNCPDSSPAMPSERYRHVREGVVEDAVRERGERKAFRRPLSASTPVPERIQSPPPHYSEIAPRPADLAYSLSARERLRRTFGTNVENTLVAASQGVAKGSVRIQCAVHRVLGIVGLAIGNLLLRIEISVQKDRLYLKSEKQQLAHATNTPNYHSETTATMSVYSFHPSVGDPSPADPVSSGPDDPTPEEEVSAASSSEFGGGAGPHEEQPVKRKPYNANDAPSFAGPNVTEFLEAFEDYCRDRAIPLVECIPRISRQCQNEDVKETIEELPSFTGHSWKAFRKALLEEFEDLDPKQHRNTEDYLRSLVIADDITADKLESFCNKWDQAQKSLVSKGKRSEAELTLILVDLLPKKLLERAIVGADLDRSKMDTLRTGRPIANLRKEAERRRCVEKIQPVPTRKERKVAFTNVQGEAQENPYTTLRPPIPSATTINKLAKPALPPALRASATKPVPKDPVMDELADRLAAIAMSLERSTAERPQEHKQGYPQNNAGPPNHANNSYGNRTAYSNQYSQAGPVPNNRPYANPQNPPQYQNPPRNNQGQAQGWSAPGYPSNSYGNQGNGSAPQDRPCVYCGEMGHFKPACGIMWNDIRAEKIHLVQGRVHEGPAGKGGPEIDVRGTTGIGMRVKVASLQNETKASDPPVVANQRSISVTNPYEDYPEESSEPPMVARSRSIAVVSRHEGHPSPPPSVQAFYDSDDDLIDTSSEGEAEVYVARAEKRKVGDAFNSQQAKETLRKRVAKEAKLPSTKNKLSNSGWHPAVEAKHDEDMVMDEGYEAPKHASVEKPLPKKAAATGPKTALTAPKTKTKQSWLQQQMADRNPENFLMKVMKGAKLDLSLWDILSHSPTLQDLIFKKYLVPIGTPSAQSLQESPLAARSNLINVSPTGRVSYLEDCPKINIRLGDRKNTHKALIDCGAECNVLTTGLVDANFLPVSLGTTLVMKSHTGHFKDFVGVAENVPIRVGNIWVEAHFFIIEDAEQEIVLGNPYMKSAKLSFRYDDSGNQWATVCDTEGDEVEVLASRPRSEARQQKELLVVRGKGKQD